MLVTGTDRWAVSGKQHGGGCVSCFGCTGRRRQPRRAGFQAAQQRRRDSGRRRARGTRAPAAPALTFQVMAFLLRKKSSLLTPRVLQLILAIAGTAELGFGPSAHTNIGVFQHVLCNFEVNGTRERGACRGV